MYFSKNSANYYSQARRHLYVRAAEHMVISYLTNKPVKIVKQSIISDHLLTCDCNRNFDDFAILSNETNGINLVIKGNLLVAHNNPILNKTVESFPLQSFTWKELYSGQLPHEENCPPVRVGVWVKVRVSFRIGGNQTITPKENCPPD